ncbi:hypothetical protein QR665_21555 [Acinetobacter gerneri]|uniref:hypothetical protein n=1 Tax=Acinetobacter gerneri TaxID=202952 RepID=UPI002936CEAB|nr:hypothetical protein [Acinetobacter gerneri]MDV2441998.1 hypothetical protein [Acinetobacter gerneri]
MPNISNKTSKLLTEVFNIHDDYLDRVSELKDLSSLAINEVENMQKIIKSDDLNTIIAIYKAIKDLSFSWCDYIEENKNIIREVNENSHLDSILYSFDDDLTSYLERAGILLNLIKVMRKEIESLYMVNMDFRQHYQHLNSLTSVICRSFKSLCADIEAEQDVFSDLNPEIMKVGA